MRWCRVFTACVLLSLLLPHVSSRSTLGNFDSASQVSLGSAFRNKDGIATARMLLSAHVNGWVPISSQHSSPSETKPSCPLVVEGEDHDRRTTRKRTQRQDHNEVDVAASFRFPPKPTQQRESNALKEEESLWINDNELDRIHIEDAMNSLAPSLWVMRRVPRGGAKNNKKDTKTTEEEVEEEEEEESVVVEVTSGNTSSVAAAQSVSSPISLFQQNNDILADTIAHGEQGDDTVDFQKNRGGALLVKQGAPSRSRRRPRLFPWFAATVEDLTDTDATTQRARNRLEQMWWNNAWMDHTHPSEQGVLDDDDDEADKGILVARRPNDDYSNDIVIVVEEDDNNADAREGGQGADVVDVVEAQEDVKQKKKPQPKKKRKRNNKQKDKDKEADEEHKGAVVLAEPSPPLHDKKQKHTKDVGTSPPPQTPGVSLDEGHHHHHPNTTEVADDILKALAKDPSPYTSSGVWKILDAILTLGFSLNHPAATWKPSRSLRPVRKAFAHVTGLHGVLSGKPRVFRDQGTQTEMSAQELERKAMLQKRLASIDRARGNVAQVEAEKAEEQANDWRPFWRRDREDDPSSYSDGKPFVHNLQAQEQERLKHERLREIDGLMTKGAERMAELATEKDLLQNMLNPLFNYSTTYDELDQARRTQEQELLAHNDDDNEDGNSNETMSFEEKLNEYEPIVPEKEFSFPPDDLVDDYLDMLFSSGRLVKMNHTDLWKNGGGSLEHDLDDDDDDDDDEDWLTTEEQQTQQTKRNQRRKDRQAASSADYHRNLEQSGSRWLRNGLGEKIGVALEMVSYKAVCANVMGILAKSLAAMHGANVMGHADICVRAEYIPVLPPNLGPSTESYASQAFYNAISSNKPSSTKKKKRKKKPAMDSVQRHAVVETMLSQCQMACPLLKLFPLAWQRALLGNMVTMITSVLSDFLEGVEFQILGHRLEFVFKPITEQDMMKRLEQENNDSSFSTPPHPARSHQAFEAAVHATTLDMAENLQFLDKWHERVLGGDSIRTQIAALIARVVLSLVDDILSQARMDLWSNSVGGPRLVTGLYYRTPPNSEKPSNQ